MKIETNEMVNLLNHWKIIDDRECPMSEIERDLHWMSTHPDYHMSMSYADRDEMTYSQWIANKKGIKDNYEYESERLSRLNSILDRKKYHEGQYVGKYFTYQLPISKSTRYLKILNEYRNDSEHITYDYLCVEFRTDDNFAYNTNVYYCSCTSPLSGLGETYKEIDKEEFNKAYNKAIESFNSYLDNNITVLDIE